MEAVPQDGRRFLLLATTPGLAVTMLAAGLSFNIPQEQTAHVGTISFFFFLFMIIYSVSALAVRTQPHPITDNYSSAWAQYPSV